MLRDISVNIVYVNLMKLQPQQESVVVAGPSVNAASQYKSAAEL